jgi:hypothetical protein
MWYAWGKGAYRVLWENLREKATSKTLAFMGNNIKIDVH